MEGKERTEEEEMRFVAMRDFNDFESNATQLTIQKDWSERLGVKGFLNQNGIPPRLIVFVARKIQDGKLSEIPLEEHKLFGIQFVCWNFDGPVGTEEQIMLGLIPDILDADSKKGITVEFRYSTKRQEFYFHGYRPGQGSCEDAVHIYYGEVIQFIY